MKYFTSSWFIVNLDEIVYVNYNLEEKTIYFKLKNNEFLTNTYGTQEELLEDYDRIMPILEKY